MGVAAHNQKLSQNNRSAIRLVPPWFIEYGFYASLVYGFIGPVLGLQIDRLGIVFLACLASLCFLYFRERAVDIFRFLVFPVGLGISYLSIQIMFHGLSIQQEYVKMFIPWLLTLIVVQSLSFRKGFLHRFVILALLLGGSTLFFLDLQEYGKEGIERLSIEKGVGLSNSNALADWFGFCAVYMYMFGAVAERHKIRMASWIIATGCLFIVTLTVSRGALLASVIAMALGSREFLKRGFFPVLLLLILAWILYVTGLFDQAITFYTMRATEESGRFLVWPRAFNLFLDAPLTGVGASKMGIFIPEGAKKTTPHNGFLFIAMASGIIPLVFYSAYWIQAFWVAFWQAVEKVGPASVHLPLVVYAFLTCFLSNLTFMRSWVIVTLVAAVGSSVKKRRYFKEHSEKKTAR